jgi:uncharacterized protein with PQ loop repeat
MGAVYSLFRNIHQTRKKRLAMENLTLFIIGLCIFLIYMSFLIRMINKQHGIQKNAMPKVQEPQKNENDVI